MPSNPPKTQPRPVSAPDLATIVLAGLGGTYLVWFVLASPLRRGLLAQLANPFDLIAQWFGPAGTELGLLDRVPVLAMALLILAAAFGLGRLLIDWVRMAPDCTPLECGVFSVAIGLNALSTLVLLGGLAGLLHLRWLAWLMVGGLAGFAIWRCARDLSPRNAAEGVPYRISAIRNPQSAIAWLAALFAGIILLGACLPPGDFDVLFDVLEYHLQVPKEWFQEGRITFLPHNVYGNMPLSAEMNALLAMALLPGPDGWFYGALAGKVAVASYSILTAAGLYCLGDRLGGKSAGWIAAIVYLSHPWVAQVSTGGLNDGVLAANVFLAAYAAWLARQGKCSFLIPGWLAGASAAVKYPGLAFAVVPLAIWAAWPIGKPAAPSWRKQAIAVGLFIAGVIAGGGAWYAKNAVLAGNPVYPLAYNVFDGQSRTPQKDAQWRKAHQVPHDALGRAYSLGQLAGSAARIAGTDDLASPLVVPLCAAAIVGLLIQFRNPQSAIRNPQSTIPFAALALVIIAIWWLFSHRIDRFLLPLWPFAALLAGIGATWRTDRLWIWSTRGILLAGLSFCLVADNTQLVGDNRWFVSLAQLRRERPHRFLNERAAPGEAVLLVGDAIPFDLEMPAYYSTCFDDCLLCDWMLGKTADQRQGELSRRHIAWVFVDWNEIRRYQGEGNYGFDPRFDPKLLDELVRQGILDKPMPIVPPEPGQPRPPELYRVPGAVTSEPAR